MVPQCSYFLTQGCEACQHQKPEHVCSSQIVSTRNKCFSPAFIPELWRSCCRKAWLFICLLHKPSIHLWTVSHAISQFQHTSRLYPQKHIVSSQSSDAHSKRFVWLCLSCLVMSTICIWGKYLFWKNRSVFVGNLAQIKGVKQLVNFLPSDVKTNTTACYLQTHGVLSVILTQSFRMVKHALCILN